jgi:predicted small metal-binding protein
MLKFKCRDVGFDCGFTTKGKTEDEILAQCAAHAAKDHNMKPEEITEELKSKIRSNIHKTWF